MISRRQALLGAVGVAVGRKVPTGPIVRYGASGRVTIISDEMVMSIYPNAAAQWAEAVGRLQPGETFIYHPTLPASNGRAWSVRFVETPHGS